MLTELHLLAHCDQLFALAGEVSAHCYLYLLVSASVCVHALAEQFWIRENCSAGACFPAKDWPLKFALATLSGLPLASHG